MSIRQQGREREREREKRGQKETVATSPQCRAALPSRGWKRARPKSRQKVWGGGWGRGQRRREGRREVRRRQEEGKKGQSRNRHTHKKLG